MVSGGRAIIAACRIGTAWRKSLASRDWPKLGDAFSGLASVKTHATMDAGPHPPPLSGDRVSARLPVCRAHTALMEDLASHGWAVLNLIHPCEATGAMLADGTVVTFTDEKNAMLRHHGRPQRVGTGRRDHGRSSRPRTMRKKNN